MLQDGLTLLSGSTADNLQIQYGASLPNTGNNIAELFFLTSNSELYVYDGSAWAAIAGSSSVTGSSLTGSTLATNIVTAYLSLVKPSQVSSGSGTSLTISAGDTTGSGTGGTLNLNGGTSVSGTAGSIVLSTNSTERMRFNSTGALGLSGANYGSSGQVLTSNGASAPPSWTIPVASKVSAAVDNGNYIDLVYANMSTADYFRIRVGGPNEAGSVEFATADNGVEPIYFRQYAGLYNFTTVVNEVTLLDASGNSIFSGSITASSFTGSGSGITSLNGSNISSGTVAPARLGSGTPSSSTFLRGDGVWSSSASSADASILTGTTLASNVTESSLTSVGTLTALTISGLLTVAGYKESVVTANTSTAYTIAIASGTLQILTLTGNAVFTFPSAVSGMSFTLMLKQDGTGSRSATWPASVKWPGGTTPTLTSTASKMDKFVFTSDGTNWYGSVAGQNY